MAEVFSFGRAGRDDLPAIMAIERRPVTINWRPLEADKHEPNGHPARSISRCARQWARRFAIVLHLDDPTGART